MFVHRLKTLRNGIGNAIDLAIHSHDAIIVSHEYNKLLAGLFKRAEECDQELQDDQKKRAFSDSNTSLACFKGMFSNLPSSVMLRNSLVLWETRLLILCRIDVSMFSGV